MKIKSISIIKLGGSIITDKSKPYTPNLPNIKRLAKEIKRANVPIIIVHGAGSFAHTSAKKYGGKKGYTSLWGVAKVSRDAQTLDQIVIDELINAKIPAVSFRPNSLFLSENGQLKAENLETVFTAINQGIVPVLYGDVIMDGKWKTTIFSGETSTKYLVKYLQSKRMQVSKIIQVGVTDGVYGADNNVIMEINISNYKIIKAYLFEVRTVDVTGGMQHKVENALGIARSGVSTYIINGSKKDRLFNTLRGKNKIFTVVK